MLLVGLTGGIGSGKTTVAAILHELGAVVLDADEFARRAIEPRTPGHERVVREFGPDVVGDDGTIDRGRLAAKVFSDPYARRRLEAIVHPEVARLLAESVEPYRSTDRVVVYSVPLLVENHLESAFDRVVVVEAPEDVRVARLVGDRGMSEDDARARIAAQASDEDRRAVADDVIENAGDARELRERVLRMWSELVRAAERPS